MKSVIKEKKKEMMFWRSLMPGESGIEVGLFFC